MEFCNILEMFGFTKIKAVLDIYYKEHCIHWDVNWDVLEAIHILFTAICIKDIGDILRLHS